MRSMLLALLLFCCGAALAGPDRLDESLREAESLHAEGHYLLASKRIEQLFAGPGLSPAQRARLQLLAGANANRMLRFGEAATTLAPLVDGPAALQRGATLELALARNGLGERAEALALLGELAKTPDAPGLRAGLLRLRLQATPASADDIANWWAGASRLSPGEASPLALAALRLMLERGLAGTTARQLLAAAQPPSPDGLARHAVELGEAESHLLELESQSMAAVDAARASLRQAESSKAAADDLRYRLEWRVGRLLAKTGQLDGALAAYQRAVAILEQLRIDLPITYADGASSHSVTLQPVYAALVDLLLQRAASGDSSARQRDLLAARRISELLKQSELQDYLGERCAVAGGDATTVERPAPGEALLYPLILADRTEILVQVGDVVDSIRVGVTADNLRILAQRFASTLRAGDEGFEAQAQALSGLLLGRLPEQLRSQGVHTLLVVPDGSLRLLPWAALLDDGAYLGERFAVATLSGLAVRGTGASESGPTLVSGVAEPGPVVDKLASLPAVSSLLPAETTRSRGLGSRRTRSLAAPAPGSDGAEVDRLRTQLALPGVREEVLALSARTRGKRMLDAEFSKTGLAGEFARGGYSTVHIATHGFFGRSGGESFLMAHDDLITMNDLERMLQQDRARRNPVEMLTLSACETAEGDERSPLGIAGVAIKARAASVVGTLWPVSDEAARRLMESFYERLQAGDPRAAALQAAQRSLRSDPEMAHPFFWAPFIVIGNWR